jgi:hypothetical protein
MAGRYIAPSEQYFDNSGDILSGGKLFFYDSGTTVAKDTFSDPSAATPNTNPVMLNGAGRTPDIYLSGSYKVIIKDANDVQIEERDPVLAADDTTKGFAIWNAVTVFSDLDIVRASNNLLYQSISDSNQNFEPSATATKWSQVQLLGTYNANQTYSAGNVVVDSVGDLYKSRVNSNTGNTPASSATQWISVVAGAFVNLSSSGAFTGNTGEFSGALTAGSVATNTVAERTSGSGVTVDGVLLKDGGGTFSGHVATDDISESTSGEGVTVDGVLLKDGGGEFTGPVESPDFTSTATSGNISFQGLQERVWNLNTTIPENTNYQRFKITIGAVRRSAMLKVTVSAKNANGIGVQTGGIAFINIHRTDGVAIVTPLSIHNADNGVGSVHIGTPVVSGSDVVFGLSSGNNGTGTDYDVSIKVELISDDPSSFSFAAITGTTAATGDTNLGQSVTFTQGVRRTVVDEGGNFTVVSGHLATDDIVETTSGEGVTIDGVVLKDGGVEASGNATFPKRRRGHIFSEQVSSGTSGTYTVTPTGFDGQGSVTNAYVARFYYFSVLSTALNHQVQGIAVYTNNYNGNPRLISVIGTSSQGGTCSFGVSGGSPQATITNTTANVASYTSEITSIN